MVSPANFFFFKKKRKKEKPLNKPVNSPGKIINLFKKPPHFQYDFVFEKLIYFKKYIFFSPDF